MQFVIDAVYAFAHALDALKKDVCPKVKGICDGMTYYDGGNFYKKYLLNVDFKGTYSFRNPAIESCVKGISKLLHRKLSKMSVLNLQFLVLSTNFCSF